MAPPPPELMEDVVGEILLRVPADDPALLFRASLVCKRWRRLLTDPAFLRSYRAFHRAPPLLGLLPVNWRRETHFVPTASFRPRDLKRDSCGVLDCRHGRVLLVDYTPGDILVWDPITGEDQRIPNDTRTFISFNAAVLCDVTDCDHLDCHGGPFLVVLVATYQLDDDEDGRFTAARVYSSESGEWGDPTAVEHENQYYYIEKRPPVLAGDSLYFTCELGRVILRYDFHGEQGLSVIDGLGDLYGDRVLISAENGGLRWAGLSDYRLDLWSLETRDPEGVTAWKQNGSIQLDTLLSIADPVHQLHLIGFAKVPDAADVVFVSTDTGVFMIWLESHKVRKVYDKDCGWWPIFPYMAFSTPDRLVRRI